MALMPSSSPQVNKFLEIRYKSSKQHVFLIIDLAKWAPRITKYEFERGISRTNEAAGLIIVFSLIQLKKMLGCNTNRFFGPGSTKTSSPKLIPTPLILLRTIPPFIVVYTGWTRSKQKQL
jgi:hypothetical protein